VTVKAEAVLQDVSDTALLVAVHRALETERRRPLFRDPYARMLAGERGARIARRMRHGQVSWPVVVRTVVLDELIMRTVERQPGACVLNLASGLDTRPYRLDLPADLLWVEADLPAILEYKAQRLAGERPRCRLERVAVDLTDAAARRRLLDQLVGRPTLVVSEGLLAYLAAEDVAALGRDLAERRDFRWWLLDLPGPLFLKWGSRGSWGRQLSEANASFRFAPEEGPDFFRPLGWEPVEVRSSWEEARRLGREPRRLGIVWALGPARQRELYRDLTRCVLLRRPFGPHPALAQEGRG
jgi:methyltransferase (TIGR00027 family)